MFRRIFLSLVAAAALAGFSRSAWAQLSPLEYGVYDFTTVYAQAGAAYAEDRRAYTELLLTAARLERELHLSPEYKAAVADVEQAHDALDNARNPILAVVAGDPHYQELSSKHDNVAAVLADGGLSARDLRDLAERKMEYGTEMRRMEADALNSDAAVQAARQRLVAAQQKLDDLREVFEATLYKNEQWAAAKKAYDNAEVALGGANGAVYGAIATACLAVEADQRHSLYGNSYAGCGLALVSPVFYYGRRY